MNGGKPTVHDQRRAHQTGQDADAQSRGNRDGEWQLRVDVAVAHRHARERDDRPGREIHAARDDHDGRANRGDTIDRGILQDEHARSRRSEMDGGDRRRRPQIPGEEQHLEHEQEQRAQLARLPDARERAWPTWGSGRPSPGRAPIAMRNAHADISSDQSHFHGRVVEITVAAARPACVEQSVRPAS